MTVSSAIVLFGSFYQKTRERRDIIAAENFTSSPTNTGFSSNMTLPTHRSLLDKLDTDDEIILCLHGIIFLLALVGNGLVS